MSTNQLRRYLDLLNEADANPYANDPKQAAIYASLSPEDQEWATRGGGRPDLTDFRIADRAPNKFTPVAQAAPATTAQSNSGTFGNAGTELVPPNTDVALPSANTFSNDDAVAAALAQQNSDTRCAVCGTPQNQHQALKHKFVSGGNTPPAPVPQGGATAGSGDVGRIKQLQKELKQAGANLGQTGAGRDGIDGDLGPLTLAAMSKYPNIAAKYADLSGSAAAPVAQAATPAVDTGKLDAALTAIESIIAKYKGKSKVSESQIYEADRPLSAKEYQARINQTIPPDSVARENPGFQQSKIKTGGYTPPAPPAAPTSPVNPSVQRPGGSREAQAFRAQQAASASAKATPKSWAARAGQAILSKLPGLGARTAARAGATALSGPLAPLIGTGFALYTIWDVGNMLYDAYKDSNNLEGMNDADQAVIKQNLAVVNSFMKDPKIADTLPQNIKTRVEKVYLDLDQLAKETGYTVPGQQPVSTAPQPAAPQPAAPQQAATPAATTVVPKLNVTLDKLDRLLKKNNFESIQFNSLRESEQLARYRDIVDEISPRNMARFRQHVVYPAAKWTKDTFIKPVAKVAGWGGIGALAWDQLITVPAPKTMSAIDQAEFEKLQAEFRELVPSQAAFDALPPDVKEKWALVFQRADQAGLVQGNK